MKFNKKLISILPYLLCLFFFLAYSTLAIVRHQHYGSFGYDLGINDQVVWRYSIFESPITTISPFVEHTKLSEHVELVYLFVSPFYWLWSSPITLLIIQSAAICFSAVAVYLLARKYKISYFVSNILLITYLIFYGVQFGIWTDVHSSVFGAAFVMWFIYFLDLRKHKSTFVFFLLALTAKESIGTALFLIALFYYWYRREKILLLYLLISMIYILFIFFIFFPLILHIPYLYANKEGLLSNLNPYSLIDSADKQTTIFYSFASWGFLPLLSPITLMPVLGHFYKFFVVASDLVGAHTLFGHYRVSLAPFLALSTIWVLKRFPRTIQLYAGLWLLFAAAITQYTLHLPLSYLTKAWFWSPPASVKNMNTVLAIYLPPTASVVSQNNITPHISQRDQIYTLYPEKRIFTNNSPCGQTQCDWFRWDGSPRFLIVDTAADWDIRHLLVSRMSFVEGLSNLEKMRVITKYQQVGTTTLYTVNKNPSKVQE